MKLLAEELQIAAGFVPADLAAAAQSGDWVSLKNYRHVAIVFFKAAGAAAEDPIITVQQATDVAGAGAKALNFTTIYRKSAADVQTVGQFTKVTQAAANTYNGDDGDKQVIYLIEFNAEDLDAEGGFDCVRATFADVGVTAQLGALLYVLSGPRYTPPPSAIID
jgi:hypothetical protein